MKTYKMLAMLVLLVSSVSFAEGKKERHGPCADDVKKFCKDVEPGGGRLMKCLKEHDAELSEGCKAKGKEMKQHMSEMHEACKGDVEKLCKDVEKGHGKVMKCLKEHKDQVSEGCKSTFKAMRKERGEKRKKAKGE